MSLRIGYRRAEAPSWEADTTADIILDGEGSTMPDFFTGSRRLLVIRSREDDGAGVVYDLDAAAAVTSETKTERQFDASLLTDENRIAIIPPGDVWGIQVVSEARYVGHVIIEAIDFGIIGDVL